VFLVMIALAAGGCGQKNPLQPVSQATPPPATPAAPPSAAPSIAAPQPPPVTPAAPPSAAPSIPAAPPTQANATPPGPQQPTPAAEPTPGLIPTPVPADPLAAQVKTALQSKGFQVLEVGFVPAKDGKPPILVAIVEADYAQPGEQAVLRQAFGVWDVLFHSLTIDSPEVMQTRLVVGERWTKYVIYLNIRVEDAANYLKSMQAAGSDEQKQETLQTLLEAIRFRVFDEEKQEYVDEKDFANKNFTK
jgi:hypothetical protein